MKLKYLDIGFFQFLGVQCIAVNPNLYVEKIFPFTKETDRKLWNRTTL